MPDLPPYADTDLEPQSQSATDTLHRTPRWVKVFGIVVLALAVVFVILQVTGVAPDHGPSLH